MLDNEKCTIAKCLAVIVWLKTLIHIRMNINKIWCLHWFKKKNWFPCFCIVFEKKKMLVSYISSSLWFLPWFSTSITLMNWYYYVIAIIKNSILVFLILFLNKKGKYLYIFERWFMFCVIHYYYFLQESVIYVYWINKIKF